MEEEKPKLQYSKSVRKSLDDREEQKQKMLEDKLKKKESNKFDYFIMICLTTIIGYLGKYSMNLFLNFILSRIYNYNYDKRLFLYYIMALYAISIILSIILYHKSLFETVEYDSVFSIIIFS